MRWASQHSSSSSSRNTNSTDPTSDHRSSGRPMPHQSKQMRRTITNTSKHRLQPPFANLPFRSETVSKPDHTPQLKLKPSSGLLSRRGINQSKRQTFILQPSKRWEALRRIIDPDFFNNDTPVDSATLKLENLSRVDLCYNTPVCESDPCTLPLLARREELYSAGLGAKSNSNERVGQPNYAKFRDNAPASASLRRASLGKAGLHMVGPVQRLNQSMIAIDKTFNIAGVFQEDLISDHGSTAAFPGPPTSHGPQTTRDSCVVDLQSTAPTISDKNIIQARMEDEKKDDEEEDPFLYLAWTSMPHPRQGGRSRPKFARKPCAPPLPPPEIVAAEARMATFKSSPMASQFNKDMAFIGDYETNNDNNAYVEIPVGEAVAQARRRIEKTSSSMALRDMLLDVVFVQMYTVDELRRRGVTASC